MLFPRRAGEAVVEDIQPVRSLHSGKSSAQIVSPNPIVIMITKYRDFKHGRLRRFPPKIYSHASAVELPGQVSIGIATETREAPLKSRRLYNRVISLRG